MFSTAALISSGDEETDGADVVGVTAASGDDGVGTVARRDCKGLGDGASWPAIKRN